MVLEIYVELLATAATLFGVFMSLAHFPQAYKIYKRKSSADISILTYSLFLTGVIIWLLYGLSINNIALIASNSVAVFGVSSVIIMYFVYKK